MRIAITGAAGMLGARFSRRARNGPDQSAFCRIGRMATTIDRAAGRIPDQDTGY
jgi:nucleoside-diphosphate-sugar epimerase